MIPLAVPNIGPEEEAYLRECVTTTFVSSVGPFVSRLEAQVAAASGARGGVALASGTAGLHVALRTIGVGPGDLVALPTLTFIASANAIAYCGATPWLLDVDDATWTLDPGGLAEAFRRDLVGGPHGPVHRPSGRRLAAVLAVHTLGHPADLDPIVALARRYEIPVVADAAAALGATYRDRPIGACGATASVFSFNGNKTVTAGGGGVLVSDDDEVLARARHLSTTARVGSDYDHDEVGYNYRMTNVQAAVGCAQMEKLDRFVARKREVDRHYRDRLGDLPGVSGFPDAPWARSACWFSGVVLPERTPAQVAQLRDQLREDGVDARPFWKPMHLQRPYADAPRTAVDVAERLWPHVLTLPCSTGITDAELDEVVLRVRERLAQ